MFTNIFVTGQKKKEDTVNLLVIYLYYMQLRP